MQKSDLGAEGPAGLEAVLRALAADRADDCLVDLSLAGAVSLADRSRLDTLLDDWRAKLVRLDVEDRVIVVPSDEEVRNLADRPADPIIGRVAAELVARIEAGGDGSDDARMALRILHGLVQEAAAGGGAS